MKRFRIKKTDIITINVTKENKLLLPSLTDSGFSSIEQAKLFALNRLGWPYKGYGRRIEIAIHNMDTGQTKYLNTFS